jgi:hypothetical protein
MEPKKTILPFSFCSLAIRKAVQPHLGGIQEHPCCRRARIIAVKVVFSLGVILIASSAASCQQATIRIPYGLDDWELIRFDPNRISASEVKHWMKFAEQGYYASRGVSLSGCDAAAASKMSRDLENTRRVQEELAQESHYPAGLTGTVNYLKRLLLLRVWMGEQYVAFAKTGAAPELLHSDFESGECTLVSEHIRTAADRTKSCQLLGEAWTNCIWKASLHYLGAYPKATWKALLEANGIEEHVISTTSE